MADDEWRGPQEHEQRFYGEWDGRRAKFAGSGLNANTVAIIIFGLALIAAVLVIGPALAQRNVYQSINGPLQELQKSIEQQASAQDAVRGMLADMRLTIRVEGSGGQIQSVVLTPPVPKSHQYSPGGFGSLDDLVGPDVFIPELRGHDQVMLPDFSDDALDIPVPGSGALVFPEPSSLSPGE